LSSAPACSQAIDLRCDIKILVDAGGHLAETIPQDLRIAASLADTNAFRHQYCQRLVLSTALPASARDA